MLSLLFLGFVDAMNKPHGKPSAADTQQGATQMQNSDSLSVHFQSPEALTSFMKSKGFHKGVGRLYAMSHPAYTEALDNAIDQATAASREEARLAKEAVDSAKEEARLAKEAVDSAKEEARLAKESDAVARGLSEAQKKDFDALVGFLKGLYGKKGQQELHDFLRTHASPSLKAMADGFKPAVDPQVVADAKKMVDPLLAQIDAINSDDFAVIKDMFESLVDTSEANVKVQANKKIKDAGRTDAAYVAYMGYDALVKAYDKAVENFRVVGGDRDAYPLSAEWPAEGAVQPTA